MNNKIKYINSYKKNTDFSVKPFDLSLVKSLKKNGGRNNTGRITVRHRGGGHKRRYRLIDFKFKNDNAIIKSIEYDPNRTSFIDGCTNTITGQNFYTLLPEGLKINDEIGLKKESDPVFKNGYFSSLRDLPLGSLIHSLELKPGKGAQLGRSAGTYMKLLQKNFELNLAKVKLPSKQEFVVPLDVKAVLGVVSNPTHSSKVLSKAGRSRWLGKRPSVRGVAMNPIDHPHGGGEGKTSGGRPSVTPWGRLTKGFPTRKRSNNKKQF
jgi:large subunit ribosomal protein L2